MENANLAVIGVAAIIGLLVGPLLGIAVDRTVERIRPQAEHRCPQCKTGLGLASLIPVGGWFVGCPANDKHRSLRYPMVDLATSVGFGLVGFRFGSDWMLTPYLGFTGVLVVLAVIDIETHLLPNIIMWPAIWAGLFVVLVLSGLNDYPEGINSALVAAAVASGFIGAAHLAYEAGMGRGDVKLALLVGLLVGWPQAEVVTALRLAFATLIVALLTIGIGGGLYNLVRRRGRVEIAFGPALIGACMVMIVVG